MIQDFKVIKRKLSYIFKNKIKCFFVSFFKKIQWQVIVVVECKEQMSWSQRRGFRSQIESLIVYYFISGAFVNKMDEEIMPCSLGQPRELSDIMYVKHTLCYVCVSSY